MTFESKVIEAFGSVDKFIDTWVDRLESGEIKRATGVLNGIGENGVQGMCCLGVACEILNQKGLVRKRFGFDNYIYDEHFSMPSRDVQDFINCNLILKTDSAVCDNLAEKNDDGRTFKKTAAVIRNARKRHLAKAKSK
jgi:hypothetical protein